MKKILVLDNYDSFTYNLVHILKEIATSNPLDVIRNNKISLKEVDAYSHILLSPGPGLPADAGIMPDLIKAYAPKKNILGICLGHQAIGEAFGGSLSNLQQVFHGIATEISQICEDPILKGLPKKFKVCRYHSWIVNEHDLPEPLVITSRDEAGSIMSIRHKEFKVFGLQFHPESIMTEHGKEMINNWLTV